MVHSCSTVDRRLRSMRQGVEQCSLSPGGTPNPDILSLPPSGTPCQHHLEKPLSPPPCPGHSLGLRGRLTNMPQRQNDGVEMTLCNQASNSCPTERQKCWHEQSLSASLQPGHPCPSPT